jgi:hypothetical protein
MHVPLGAQKKWQPLAFSPNLSGTIRPSSMMPWFMFYIFDVHLLATLA